MANIPAASSSLYEVLGIPMGASGGEIKAAYRRLARTRHPDVVSVNRRTTGGDEEFKRINSAYSTLSDPHKRASYDWDLCRRRRRPSGSDPQSMGINSGAYVYAASSGYHGGGRRNWETDQCW